MCFVFGFSYCYHEKNKHSDIVLNLLSLHYHHDKANNNAPPRLICRCPF